MQLKSKTGIQMRGVATRNNVGDLGELVAGLRVVHCHTKRRTFRITVGLPTCNANKVRLSQHSLQHRLRSKGFGCSSRRRGNAFAFSLSAHSPLQKDGKLEEDYSTWYRACREVVLEAELIAVLRDI